MRSPPALGLLILLLAPAAASAEPQSTLRGVREVAPGVQRHYFSYGPLLAAPGQNQILVGPHPVALPGMDGFVIRTKADIVRTTDGGPPPVEVVHMHHAVYLNLSRRDTTDPGLPQRFFAWAEEKTIGRSPDGYGYRVRATDQGAINYMLHNGTPTNEEVTLTYELDFVPADTPLGRTLKPLTPVWMDVQNGEAYPVFDTRRGSGGPDGNVTYPDDYDDPYRGGPRLNEWTADRDGTLVVAAGHLHPGGRFVDLELERDGRRVHLFRSEARYWDPNGPVSWDLAMTVTDDGWRVGIRKGDKLRVSTTYEAERASWYESMGIMVAYMSEETGGPDPFVAAPDVEGDVTHGHLPEASNHGGGPSGLGDPLQALDGQTIDDRVGIGAFQYLPGDLSAGGDLGKPPTVEPGGRLRFGNLDASAGIYHTITECAPPCNRSTGISYPLADGARDFDSGQLGYGPDGYTSAKNAAEWETPGDLQPGTYTYFCRVHPFMRGAFRVSGEPSSPADARSSVRIRSRRVRVSRSGVALLRLGCEGPGCTGTLRLGGRRRVATRRYSLSGDGVVRARLSRAARRALARKGSMTVRASATGGAGARTSKRIVLVRPR